MKTIKNILIYLIPLALFFPIYIIRDYTPNNELRYVSIVDEAINNGSVVVFNNHGIPYADKPPLYFWIMMIGRMIAGENLMIFMGIINLIITAGILWIMNKWCFPDQKNGKTLLPPMLTLLTTGLFTGAILVLRMDLLMTFFIILSLYIFYKQYTGRGNKDDEMLFPLFLFLGIFTKGPVALIIPVFSIIAFLIIRKDLKKIGSFLGWKTWMVLLSLCAIWFAGVYYEGGKDYLNNLLFHQTIDRAVDSFHHKQPGYFYLVRFWLLAAPWSLFCIVILIKSIREKLYRTNQILLFFSVIIVTTFLILSLISSKVDIYLLPIYPFFVYGSFLALKEMKAGVGIRILAAIPMLALCCALPVYLYIEQQLPFRLNSFILSLISVIILTAGGLTGLWFLKRKNTVDSLGVCAGSIILFLFLNSFQISSFNDYLGMKGIAEKGKELGIRYKTPRYISFGIGRAENMEVYLGTSLRKADSFSHLSSSENYKRPYILFIREKTIEKNDTLANWLNHKTYSTAGKYKVYLID
ncbi:MAG: ArnT family glycosyltransferase [Bacteroidales bacterium]